MKHIVDTDRDRSKPMRMVRYTSLERRAGLHPNTVALHRRPRTMKAAQVPQYLRIDRGIRA
ncbi:hypothetical protein [Tropicimonas sp. S265A]|uniref:hypothetical protein n=1 Tax=Tropicimonas sp. S265A TaxID=3415134 RepID=UPI003C7AE549